MYQLLLSIAITLSRAEHYEESAKVMEFIPAKYANEKPEYHFYKLVNAYKLMDDKTAAKEIEFFDDVYYFSRPIPTRYLHIASLIKADMEHFKDNPIRPIDRKMTKAATRLSQGKAGKETQKVQKEILDDIDKLIKQKEQEAEAAAKAAAMEKARKEGKKIDKDGNIIPADAKGNMPSSPAQDTTLPTGKAGGEIDTKKFKEYARSWGNLPPKERAKAMIELTRGLPPKYREAIEVYFKKLELSSDKKKR